METGSAQQWFAAHGSTTSYVGRDGVGAHFEAGDAFAFGDALVVGYGPRTEELGAQAPGRRPRRPRPRAAASRTRGCTTSTWPSARSTRGGRWSARPPSTSASAEALLALVPEPLVLTEEEALTTFCANSVVVPSADGGPATVVMPACSGPGARAARGVGLPGRDRRRLGVPQGRRLDPLPDQPRRPHPRSRPARRSRAARSSCRRSERQSSVGRCPVAVEAGGHPAGQVHGGDVLEGLGVEQDAGRCARWPGRGRSPSARRRPRPSEPGSGTKQNSPASRPAPSVRLWVVPATTSCLSTVSPGAGPSNPTV